MRGTWFHPDQSGPIADVFPPATKAGSQCWNGMFGIGWCRDLFGMFRRCSMCVQGV